MIKPMTSIQTNKLGNYLIVAALLLNMLFGMITGGMLINIILVFFTAIYFFPARILLTKEKLTASDIVSDIIVSHSVVISFLFTMIKGNPFITYYALALVIINLGFVIFLHIKGSRKVFLHYVAKAMIVLSYSLYS
jgi:hypothetical protein